MKKFEVKGHAPSLLPDGYDFELVWSDEFDGDTLDTTKWDYRLCMMGKRHPAWTDKGVKIRNSCAEFSIFEENGEIVSSQLQTGYNFMDQPVTKTMFGTHDYLQWPVGKLHENKFTHKFGYYECYCKLQQLPGWWSAFWIQSPIIGASLDSEKTGSEIDVMECFIPGTVHNHNVFTGGYGLDMRRTKVGGKEVDPNAFHYFGLLWLPDRYVFYVDGVEDGVVTDHLSHTEEFILISTEPKGYRHEDHLPTAEAKAAAKTNDVFLVDHVRVFDIKK